MNRAHAMKPSHNTAGFTLLSMLAVLVVVAALIAATILSSKDREATWQPQITGKTNLDSITASLIQFQRTHHRLPCPAPINALPDSAVYGVEGSNCAAGAPIAGITRVDIGSGIYARIGALPVRTLGLGTDSASDAYGNRLTFAVTERLTDPYQFSDTTGALRLQDAASAPLLTDGAFALISHGRDGKGATTHKAGIIGTPCLSADGKDRENCNDDGLFTTATTITEAGADHFDDILTVKPIDQQSIGINIPCYPPRTPTPHPWGGTCSGSFTNMLNGVAQTLTNSASGYSGTADVTCNNGSLTTTSFTCN